MNANDIVDIHYQQTGQSTTTNELGMREMQAKVFEARNKKYLLVKAPPASGKSRALMFVALDKLMNQGIRKVVVAVAEPGRKTIVVDSPKRMRAVLWMNSSGSDINKL